MKKTITLLSIVLNFTILFSQVGINTNSPDPTVQLDVNGQVKIQTITPVADPVPSSVMNSILVSSAGVVKSVTPVQIVGAVQNGVLALTKGVGTGSNQTINAILGTSINKIQFVSSYDLHSDFNFTNGTVGGVPSYTFKAPVTGYYNIYFQTLVSSGVSAATTITAAVVSTPSNTVLARGTSAALVAALNSAPFIVRTSLKLNAGDQISFVLSVNAVLGLAITASGNPIDTFFTVEQIR